MADRQSRRSPRRTRRLPTLAKLASTCMNDPRRRARFRPALATSPARAAAGCQVLWAARDALYLREAGASHPGPRVRSPIAAERGSSTLRGIRPSTRRSRSRTRGSEGASTPKARRRSRERLARSMCRSSRYRRITCLTGAIAAVSRNGSDESHQRLRADEARGRACLASLWPKRGSSALAGFQPARRELRQNDGAARRRARRSPS